MTACNQEAWLLCCAIHQPHALGTNLCRRRWEPHFVFPVGNMFICTIFAYGLSLFAKSKLRNECQPGPTGPSPFSGYAYVSPPSLSKQYMARYSENWRCSFLLFHGLHGFYFKKHLTVINKTKRLCRCWKSGDWDSSPAEAYIVCVNEAFASRKLTYDNRIKMQQYAENNGGLYVKIKGMGAIHVPAKRGPGNWVQVEASREAEWWAILSKGRNKLATQRLQIGPAPPSLPRCIVYAALFRLLPTRRLHWSPPLTEWLRSYLPSEHFNACRCVWTNFTCDN